MPENRLEIERLLQLWVNGKASEGDRHELLRLLKATPDTHNSLAAGLDQLWEKNTDSEAFSLQQRDALTARILQRFPATNDEPNDEQPPVHRVHFLRRGFLRYAAAVLLLLGVGAIAIVLLRNRQAHKPGAEGRESFAQAIIAPGGDKAVLTLANGTQIILDTASNGQLTQQGNTQVVKLANGQLAYQLNDQATKEVMLNTMSTPVGGQYRVMLPDGTKVWLNASSSITFPTAFTGKKRAVKISGEVYFEVTKNPQQPFVVDIDGRSSVEVLGTSFNINSYEDEKNIRTTLLEGSVKVKQGDRQAILQPGQQAEVATDNIKIASNADLVQALAWKNGLFNFNGLELAAVMRQLERWYDIQVQYKGTQPNTVFEGKVYRDAPLSDVLYVLKDIGVKFELQGRTLIVY